MKVRGNLVFRWLLIIFLVLFFLGFLIPEFKQNPVQGASDKDWNAASFWYEPWGTSGVHKGVDIFARKGTHVMASTWQLVLYRGEIKKGGNVVLTLGPKWRLHYYAHLASIFPDAGLLLTSGTRIGAVGDTGNAKNKPPHLHYSVVSLLPLLWKIDDSTQGYKKAFYVNPEPYIKINF